ncbi:S24 family peptidase [Salinicola sp. RZ23]|uniref:LexA family protein n=1 Tax=Salinicola sp. RZ23 TaxID=1949087 RepID=UPI001E5164DD|nr:S24 family peptidase [Salinicola sp. RZ23]
MSRIQLIGQAPSSPPRLDIPCAEVLARAGIAGFASPAEDYAGRSFDLNERFIKHQAATFIFQVSGDSMEEYRIYEGDFFGRRSLDYAQPRAYRRRTGRERADC